MARVRTKKRPMPHRAVYRCLDGTTVRLVSFTTTKHPTRDWCGNIARRP